MFTYPASQLDQPDDLHQTLGSFWQQVYGDHDMIAAYCGAKGQLELQTLDDLNEAVAAVGRTTCPVFHRVRWLPLALTQSQGTTTSGGTTYPVPVGLVEVPLVSSAISDPSCVLMHELDYTLGSGGIEFAIDPFAQPQFVQRALYDQSGNPIDYEIVLWLFGAELDTNLLYNQFGYVLGLSLPSSAGYKLMVNATWDALTAGSARKDLEAVLVAITDASLAEGDETVLHTTADSSSVLVITDLNVYRYASTAVPVVVPGQVLVPGQALVNAFQIYELNTGQVPPVPSIVLGPEFLDPSIQGPLTFQNAFLPVQVSTAADGHTVVQFQVDGNPTDVAQFWARIDAKGLAAGQTLAKLLDMRANKLGEPPATALPAMLNPAQFLVQNVLRHSVLLVVVQPSAFGPNALGLDQLSFLRKIVPPHTALLIQVS
jgi:hypothetical protein